MITKPLLALSITAAMTSTAFAHEDFRQHEAHVHGHVELNIAQDSHDLLIEVTAPGADIVGFEHAPENDQQKAALNNALKTLKSADYLFTLTSAAKCHLEQINVMHTLEDSEKNHHEHEHEHEHAKHEDEHHKHDAHHHDKEVKHGSFSAQYNFHCDNIAKLNKIDTQWFKLFPATKEIDVNLLTDKVQTALELKPGKTTISL